MLNKGVFMISFDTELAWGTHGDSRYAQAYKHTREVVDIVLEILERHRLSATWAVVGQLFLESSEQNDIWHAPDIVQRIVACPVHQEIGCHSFSHNTYESSCDCACFDRDLEQCQAVALDRGIALESFVYPRNVVKYPERLAAHGFRIFRGCGNEWYHQFHGMLRRIGHAVDAYCWPYAPVGALSRKDGVLTMPGNQLFLHRVGWARWVPVGFQVRKAIHGIDRAARERKIFHLWTHPFNLATDTRNLVSGFQKICEHAAHLRDKGVLENMTMGQLAHRYG